MISLIAPAGNYDMGVEALARGADELYAGLKNWSLRSPCFEMTLDDIRRLLHATQEKGKTLRVCLNTYPWEGDLPSFDSEVERLVNMGVRSFVLADVGNITVVRRRYPDVSIQASVACDIRNIDDVRSLDDAGASAVTLLWPTRSFIAQIRRETKLDVLIFAYGYSNYTYRARCYMSSYLRHAFDSRSAAREAASGSFNREGFCNRACKCHWRISSGEFRINDVTMNSSPFLLIDQLPGLLRAGATGLKVQGREYSTGIVIEAIRLYREVLDRFTGDPDLEAFPEETVRRAIAVDHARQREMRERTGVMIREMLGVEPTAHVLEGSKI